MSEGFRAQAYVMEFCKREVVQLREISMQFI